MLKDLFPKSHNIYSSLPILGSILDEFVQFLLQLGYSHATVCTHVRAARDIDSQLQQQRCHTISKITHAKLLACSTPLNKSKKSRSNSGVIKLLIRHFEATGVLQLAQNVLSIAEEKLIDYKVYLQNVRGLSQITIHKHFKTGLKFLAWLNRLGGLPYLPKLIPQDIENFLCNAGSKVGRAQLRHIVGFLRSYLNFLATLGEVPSELSHQIDTPRVYREEQLPRFLDWEVVRALLESIDRSTTIGKRDYAMLLLIATYGLRSSEIVALKLNDIDWRHNCLRLSQHKTGVPLILPLTSEVGNSIISYIQEGRPSVLYREIFVRHVAPSGILTPSAVSSIFRTWSERSCLAIPYRGVHCLRHSYATYLLRRGISLKTISDILGHRSLESTCIYLRLAVEDLRTVPLSLPVLSLPKKGELS